MPYWDGKAKVLVQDNQRHTFAVKNRFPAEGHQTASLHALLTRLEAGIVGYDSITITVTGVEREETPLLLLGTNNTASERDNNAQTGRL